MRVGSVLNPSAEMLHSPTSSAPQKAHDKYRGWRLPEVILGEKRGNEARCSQPVL